MADITGAYDFYEGAHKGVLVISGGNANPLILNLDGPQATDVQFDGNLSLLFTFFPGPFLLDFYTCTAQFAPTQFDPQGNPLPPQLLYLLGVHHNFDISSPGFRRDTTWFAVFQGPPL